MAAFCQLPWLTELQWHIAFNVMSHLCESDRLLLRLVNKDTDALVTCYKPLRIRAIPVYSKILCGKDIELYLLKRAVLVHRLGLSPKLLLANIHASYLDKVKNLKSMDCSICIASPQYANVNIATLMLNLHELSHIYQLHLENIELEKEANKLINGLPDTLAAKLEHLALRDCSLVETLQDVQWARFNCLKVLDLSGNYIAQLPPTLVGLTSLTSMRLSGTAFIAWPDVLAEMTSLRELQIGSAWLRQIPQTLGRLCELRRLAVTDSMHLTEIPRTLGLLHRLTELDLSGNVKLSHVPRIVYTLPALTVLNIAGCNIEGATKSPRCDHDRSPLARRNRKQRHALAL